MRFKMKNSAITILITYVIAQTLPALLGIVVPGNAKTSVIIYSTIACFIIGSLVMILLNKKFPIKNSLTIQPSVSKGQVLSWGFIGMFLAIFVQITANLIEQAVLKIPAGSANTQYIIEIINKYPLFLITGAIFAPILEEFVFRKVIFGFFYDLTGVVGAAVISSLLFAFIHMDGHILLYSAMGFVFCFLYVKTKNIATPIIAHMLMNTLVFISQMVLLK
ncbi:CPBP family intramembrane metalloprotease [Carnobacterium divergens]|uniref:CPBP family intramembrane metalloprotease n=2 Tax=Carnobacteriaceae TaxID=186828 RepID=A0A5F0MHG6_CARDV|nr:CPBP family intramembrane metalloprotease [Carnobacterium divergens]TFI65089.1 CPBP family intramembrane metalloprotease [Carnobacterium divergens]TFI75388.1 CPBP family intramembrane metalloprotease [Carnobacterium divergens]TFI76457.1 CPBP family intramembrane metalloprotease [Carnobacterium divergens]TFI80002.1 CPBP family intramembrane metalloprotease [Carnobacterium divergens]